MNDTCRAEALIEKLLADPVSFNERAEANQLLSEYFGGMSITTLRPLLTHSDSLVRRSAAYIASELGYRAKCLIHDVEPLIHDSDPHTRWYAIECVMVCSTDAKADQFLSVVRELESNDDWMRQLAMKLVSNAALSQLETGYKLSETLGTSAFLHAQGLKCLLKGRLVNESDVEVLLNSSAPLSRRYGAIAAKRLFEEFPEVLEVAASNSDPDVCKFTAKALKKFRRRKKK